MESYLKITSSNFHIYTLVVDLATFSCSVSSHREGISVSYLCLLVYRWSVHNYRHGVGVSDDGAQSINRVPIVEDGRLVGLLSREAIMRSLQVRPSLQENERQYAVCYLVRYRN